MTVLSVNAVHVHFGSKIALDGLSADFAIGQVTCIVGPNGAGKSTLLSVLAGLRKPDAGSVVLDSTHFATMAPRERAKRLAFLPQTPEVAWAITQRILADRTAAFRTATGREPSALELYLLWNKPGHFEAQDYKVSRVKEDYRQRAQRFANLLTLR